MLEHIKTQVVNPQIPKKGLCLHINFDKLALTQGNSYSELAKWKALKNAVINKKNPKKRKTNSVLNELLEILNTYQSYIITISTTRMGLSFH